MGGALFLLAWEYGHPGGLQEVAEFARELKELLS